MLKVAIFISEREEQRSAVECTKRGGRENGQKQGLSTPSPGTQPLYKGQMKGPRKPEAKLCADLTMRGDPTGVIVCRSGYEART
jgi:hypothetical protein